MSIIERKDWKIHPEVISFWEQEHSKRTIWCYGSEVSATYFYVEKGDHIPFVIHEGDDNVIAIWKGKKILYRFNNELYLEDYILKIIKLKSFL
jgi:hypothetical protein